MFGLSAGELALIGIVIILIFGVGRITKIGSELGSGLKSFRDSLKDDEKAGEIEDKNDAVSQTNSKQEDKTNSAN